MKKSKLIQTRVSYPKYEELSKEADSKEQSVSELVRNKLFESRVKIEPLEKVALQKEDTKLSVFQRSEFLKTIIWIYSLKENYSHKYSLHETTLYLSYINSFIMDLDSKYLDFFYNVKKDLERVINKHSPYITISYNFIKSYNKEYFDFEKFGKMILEDNI